MSDVRTSVFLYTVQLQIAQEDYSDKIYVMEWWIIATIVSTALLIVLVYSIVMPDKRKTRKIAVFDLDETLGSFTQLGFLRDIFEEYQNRRMSQHEFNMLVDENPEFIRPGILDILDFVVGKRAKGHCDAIMIYTNNNGPRSWSESIASYFDYKLGTRVFDQIICAYKANGKRVEPMRTTYDKTYADLLRCTGLPRSTQVCFFDDVFHPQMKHKNVHYINAKGYSNVVPIETSVSRRCRNNVALRNSILSYAENVYGANALRGKHKPQEEQAVDIVVGKYMLHRTQDFFNNSNDEPKSRRCDPLLGSRRKKARLHMEFQN